MSLRKQNVLVIIGVLATIVVLATVAPPRSPQPKTQLPVAKLSDDAEVFARLSQLKNGDSILRVHEVLPSLNAANGLIRIYQSEAKKNPARYPEGVEDRDVFWEYSPVQPGSIYLQARNGKLVNFDIDHYRDLLDYK